MAASRNFEHYLDKIGDYERHEDPSRLRKDLEEVFLNCESFQDQQKLAKVLSRDVDPFYTPLLEVLDFFWQKSDYYQLAAIQNLVKR